MMTCYEVGHRPLTRDRGWGLSHWTAHGEWGHGICRRWCRWGTSTPPTTQPFIPPRPPHPPRPFCHSFGPCDIAITRQPPPQIKPLIEGIMGYWPQGLTTSSRRELSEEAVKSRSIILLISNFLHLHVTRSFLPLLAAWQQFVRIMLGGIFPYRPQHSAQQLEVTSWDSSWLIAPK